MNRRLGILFIFNVLALTSCRQQLPERGMWNGTLSLSESVSMPFRMDLDLTGDKATGHFIVGNERNPIPEISRNGGFLTFVFSEYGAEMSGTWDGDQLKGNYLRRRSAGTKSFPFTATPEASPQRKDSFGVALPLGSHQVHFQEGETANGITVARLWKDADAVYGTFIAPDGDYGLLEGKPAGKGIHLSRFTGWQAFLIAIEPVGELWSGTFYAASNDKPLEFTLQPVSDPDAIRTPSKETSLKDPGSAFAFSCVSTTGEVVLHTDNRFKGKALVLDIMGTWCHNCLDESPVLQELQEQFASDGLVVVGLSFEISEDPDLGRKNLNLYRDRFGLTYPLLFCGSLDDANLGKRLTSQLNNFFAFPTTLFADKEGKVRAIHSGFRGPGTGEEFNRQVEEFHELARQITR